jgi:hypothetical protein
MKKMFVSAALVSLLLIQAIAARAADVAVESAREIPVAYTVDVVVVGGSTGAVAAAVTAAKAGAKVVLVAPRPYLGEDVAGTLRLWLEPGEEAKEPLAQALFAAGNPAKPLHVKKVLDQALLDAGVPFVYSSYATDVLRDAAGEVAGIVMANRAGRQAVVAKVIIDATDRAYVARMAGAKFADYPEGKHVFKRVVIGGKSKAEAGITSVSEVIKARKVGAFTQKEKQGEKSYDVIEYTLEIPMKDRRYASFARAEQIARDRTFDPGQQFASDMLFEAPPDAIVPAQTPCRPVGVSYLFVLGGCTGLPRDQIERKLRPASFVEMGTRMATFAVAEWKSRPELKGVRLGKETSRAGISGAPVTGDVRESLTGLRPTEPRPTLSAEERAIPVLGKYDVVVIGGGTSGTPAGIGAGRQGAKVLVIEYLYTLGGVGTVGAISKYYHGYRGGFTKEVMDGAGGWDIEPKAEWWRKALRGAGAEIWFGAIGCGAFVEGGKVKGVVVATPEGRGIVLAGVVVDSTGNADIAAAAGAPCLYTDDTDIAVQGTGLPPRDLGASYTNTDFTITDETDMVDVTSLFVYAKSKYDPNTFDMGQLIDSRERRRVVGDFTVSPLDPINQRTYPDTVAWSSTNYDTHGYTVHPYFAMDHPGSGIELKAFTPYRCLLPKGLEGILVTGLGVSVHRDALPLVRMQPDLQNQGYAAGVAAAMAAKLGGATRSIDIKALQKHLVKIGCLPETVLKDEDSYPLPPEKIAEAVATAGANYKGVSVILANPEPALPLVRKACDEATSPGVKLRYAHILGHMGDATGLPALIAAVEAAPDWDAGWNYKSQGQFGANLSRLDALIVAIGRTGDPRGTPAILNKVRRLDATADFSHHRACALALESLKDPAAIDPLVDLLAKPRMRGHALHSIEAATKAEQGEGLNGLGPRRNALRELMLARALYRCGDKNGLGKKILEEYETDIRGHFARHAQAVLAKRRGP